MNLPNKQYISLDNLDLCLLSQHLEKPIHEKTKMWSQMYMDGETEYYEVDIAEEVQDEDVCVELNYKTLPCHICNLDVPEIYYNQHMKTKKHQTYKKLAERLLENVAKQINIDIDQTVIKDYDNFYCEICSEIIPIKYRGKHKKSKKHLMSIQNDMVADRFLEMYIGRKMVDNDNHNIYDKHEILDECNFITCGESSSDEESEQPKNTSISINNHIRKANLQSGEELLSMTSLRNQLGGAQPMVAFILYLKAMITKYELAYELPILENNNVVVVTPKGVKQLIPINIFHGFVIVSDVVWCNLCGDWITARHITTQKHVLHITQPVNDNFARKLAQVSSESVLSHCLLCNIIVSDDSHHATNSEKHKSLVQIDILKTEKTDNVVKKSAKTFCYTCNVNIDTHNYLAHTKGKLHKSHLNTNNNEPDEPIVVKNHVVSLTDPSFCKICQVAVPKGGMGIHVKGRPHLNNVVKCNTLNVRNEPSTSALVQHVVITKRKRVRTRKKKVNVISSPVNPAGLEEDTFIF